MKAEQPHEPDRVPGRPLPVMRALDLYKERNKYE